MPLVELKLSLIKLLHKEVDYLRLQNISMYFLINGNGKTHYSNIRTRYKTYNTTSLVQSQSSLPNIIHNKMPPDL